MSDDEPRRAEERLIILPLDPMDLAELDAYVAALRTEIVRAEAAIAAKRARRDAADSVFRRPDGGARG